ncbi:MAG: S9 family peptidase, partial [Bryobacteraceae bacterium]
MKLLRLIFLAFTALSAMYAAKSPITSDHLWDLRTVADPQITKDGTKVIYVLSWPDKMIDQTHSNLWIVGADGKDPRPLTTGAFRDSSPKLSPDNTRLA